MIITQTPLRISFLGGGTDFLQFYREHGGCVLTTAIDKYVYCIVQKRFDEMIKYVKDNPDIVAIVTYRVDRITRNYRDAVLIDDLRLSKSNGPLTF